jgi:hypothetical protein
LCAGQAGRVLRAVGEGVVLRRWSLWQLWVPDSKQRLINGSCAIVCNVNQDCPTDNCNGCGNPNTEGANHCIRGPLDPQKT